jgi:transmembrane sensor
MHSRSSSPADFSVLEQAAEWFAVLQSESVNDDEKRRWREWFDANLAHRQAWQRVLAVSRQFGAVADTKEQREALVEALDAAARFSARRRTLKSLVWLTGAGAITWSTSRYWPNAVANWRADHRSGVGEISEIRLADGTRAWLDTDSAVDLEFNSRERGIHLRAGAVLIETAGDPVSPSRPLLVSTEEGRVRAIGTRFHVRQHEAATDVAVFEGAVELHPDAGGSPMRVDAGSQARLLSDRVEPREPADPAREAWSRGMLLVKDQRLEDFVRELARYRSGHLACAPEVADLRVAGAYPLGDTDRTLRMVSQALPVRIHKRYSWWVTVEPL